MLDPDNPLAGRLRPGMSVGSNDPDRHDPGDAMTIAVPTGTAGAPVPGNRADATTPLIGVAAVLLGAFISTLNTRVTTFGLADIRGALGLGFDEGSWITTVFGAGANGGDASGGLDEHRPQHAPRPAVDRHGIHDRLRCCRRSSATTIR